MDKIKYNELMSQMVTLKETNSTPEERKVLLDEILKLIQDARDK